MWKALLAVLLVMPGGFIIVPALLLIRRRWGKRYSPPATTARTSLPALPAAVEPAATSIAPPCSRPTPPVDAAA